MNRARIFTSVTIVIALAATALFWQRNDDRARSIPMNPSTDGESEKALSFVASHSRATASGEREGTGRAQATVAVPATPRSAEELQALVRWMKSLPREQLLLLTNAEFRFEKSALIEMLQALEGDWVIAELERLTVAEPDDLVRASLTVGLLGGFSPSRVLDPRMLVAIRTLLPQFVSADADPFQAACWFGSSAYQVCARQKQDMGGVLLPFLAESDNPSLLTFGYMYVGMSGSSASAIAEAFVGHAHADGRFGALEGLRHFRRGGVPPEEIARVGGEALRTEDNPRNRMLIVEMLGSSGGEAGLDALRDIVRTKQSDLLSHAASMLATKLPPDEALDTLSSALQDASLSEQDRGALYQALGAIESPATGERLLGVANDPQRSDVERLQGLQALWHRPMDDDLSHELTSILESDAPGSVRAESLKMLIVNSESAAPVDVKSLAVSDAEPAVRREAVLLGALEGGPDAHGWLEERLLTDNSPDVRAAALGAMVMQAHYSGESGAVLDHLGLARKLTNDAQVLDLIAQGEQMVRSYDPRRFELELQADAELYGSLSKYLSGPAQRDMQRRARYLEKMVTALRPR
ncbi:MAG: HEAT repeat domain-containing protein [Planctomycetota bacterium]